MDLLSEEEQWERLKAWVRTNAPSVLGLAALLLIGWFGWQWWQERGQQQALGAGAIYQSIISGFDEGRQTEAFALIETLRAEHPDSGYVSAADLVAANVHVGNNELDKAVERLQRVATSATDEQLRPIARLRLARVQSAKGEYEAALATLGTADMGLHEPARLEVRGDVLLASGDRAAALQEYLSARKLLPPAEPQQGGVGELLDLKIADLGGAPAVEAAESGPAGAANAPADASVPETSP